MKTRAYGIIFVTAMLLAGACTAQTLTRPTAIDLNGKWRDERGHTVEITQKGSQVTLKTAAGREFSGSLSGPLLELQHSLTPEETEPNLPGPVRELCSGQIVTIHSVVSEDRNEIKGTYTGKKPKWEKKGEQYSILGWEDVPDDSLFNRNGYYISELSIDYYGWEHAHHELQDAVTNTQDMIKIKQATFDQARQMLETRRAQKQQTSAVLEAKRTALRAAMAKAAVTDPPESAKSAEYKSVEQQIAKLNARQAKLEDYFDQLHKGTIKGDPQAISKLFEEYDQNKATLAGLQSSLQKLQNQSGFTAQVAAAAAAAQKAEDDYYDAYKADTHARSDFESAEAAAVRAQQSLDEANNNYYVAVGALNKFSSLGSPRIVGVRVGSYYDVSYWTPADTLRDLDKSIAAVQDRLRELEDQRAEDRTKLDAASQRALAAGQVLAGKQDWKGGSAISQVLIETGFYAYDVGKAWKNGGPAGALFEAVKQGVEGLVLGPPTFADPEISEADKDAVFEHARDTMLTTVGQNTPKIVTGYGADVATAAFLKAENEAALADTFQEVSEVVRSGGTVEAALIRRFRYQKTFRDEAVKKFEEAVKGSSFRKFGAEISTKFVVGVAKDLLKEKMKQSVADFFVKDAFLDYLEADLQCRGAALLMLKDNARYHEAHDTLAYLIQLRAEIERQYDPKSHMKVKRNQTFYSQAGLGVELDDASSASAQRAATVILGGKDAAAGGAALHYKVNAYELAQTADGGVKLEVKVTH